MGSLNYDGSKIQKANETYRNVGGAISVTQQELPNSGSILVEENANKPYLRGTDADQVLTQYATQLIGPARKITDSDSDSLIERQTARYVISASGNPEISLIPVRDYADRHTGDNVVLGDAATDTVVTRHPNTSFRP